MYGKQYVESIMTNAFLMAIPQKKIIGFCSDTVSALNQ